jgi:hypothetical protein
MLDRFARSFAVVIQIICANHTGHPAGFEWVVQGIPIPGVKPDNRQRIGKDSIASFQFSTMVNPRKCFTRTELLHGADSQIRTDDLLITNQLLYQLSYAGGWIRASFL